MKGILEYAKLSESGDFEVRSLSQYINEVRRRGDDDAVDADDINVKDIQQKVAVGGKTVPISKAQNAKAGVSADNNGSNGIWAVDPPTEQDEKDWADVDRTKMSKNMKKLATRLKTGADFLVLGDAGWAKTGLIVKTAHMTGYHIITVYLDKAVGTDLGGIPVPTKDEKTGAEYMQYFMPGWAVVMLMHPEKKYLLFFDEMNQAQPDVLNALMPIVLNHTICGVHFDNIIVGAAGNESKQNDSLSEINQPLRDRFKPIIQWETHTDDTWNEWFDWAHKHWDNKIGKNVVDRIKKLQDYWNSPRDITRVIFEWLYNGKGGNSFEDPEEIRERLDQCIWDDIDSSKRSSKLDDELNKLAQFLYEEINKEGVSDDGGSSDDDGRKAEKRGDSNVDPKEKKTIMDCLAKGYFYNSKSNYPDTGDNKKYLCTLENVLRDMFDPALSGVNPENLKKLVKEMEASGKSVKYMTNKDGEADAKKNGWEIL